MAGKNESSYIKICEKMGLGLCRYGIVISCRSNFRDNRKLRYVTWDKTFQITVAIQYLV